MSTRLLIASTALTAVVGLSAYVAISMAGSNHAAPQSAALSSVASNHLAPAPAQVAAAHPGWSAVRANHIAGSVGAVSASANGAPASASNSPSSSTPTLLTVQGGSHELAHGAQKAVPVAVNESQAMQAIFKGGMWLPNTSGGREYAKYDHHLIHDNGDWTWVGKVQTAHGLQSAVITFGKDAVFGRIPQARGNALRLVTADGRKMLVQTDGGKMAASALNRQLYARQDFKVPQHKAVGSTARSAAATTRTTATAQTVAAATTTSGGPTIDVMVAYTNGYASAQGSTSAALTRINNLVDVTNQAYSDSGVSQRIRLVHTMEVNYTDTNDNTNALDDVTGNDGNGNSVPVPSALQGIASARTQYGADLVVLLRQFNDAGNNGCGVAWLIGGGGLQIVPSEDNAFGYAVVQDGSDGGYFCLDSTFAHELGHTMGSAHDRAHSDQSGAYAYAYGYLGNGTDGFSTIMAYGSDTQTPLDLFSNPDISKCQNSPCGVADSSTSAADNVHSLNNTAGLIAQFEATKVVATDGTVHNDVDGDGHSDLLFQNQAKQYFGWWLMNGTNIASMHNQAVTASGYTVVATGDFNGDGKADIVWTNSARAIYIWSSNGSGGFSSPYIGTFGAGWKIVGAGDVDGDGKADLLFQNTSSHDFGWWLMDGTKVLSTHDQLAGAGYQVAGAGDFNGDGLADIAWTDDHHQVVVWLSTGSGFIGQHLPSYGPSWSLVGVGDVNGDGRADLLFHSATLHNFCWWLLDGTSLLSTQKQVAGSGYHVAATGDFNGDGRTDVAWVNNASSAFVIWSSTGSGFDGRHIQSFSSGWELVP